MALEVQLYDPALRAGWDRFVRASKNGTFLFLRGYMDYHGHRFQDCSLIVRDGRETVALLPANRSGDEVHSHQGLTYGGLVSSAAMTTPRMLDVFDAVTHHLRAAGVRRLFYKTVPAIYHRQPAEEDRYALFLAGAALYRRDVLSVVAVGRRAPIQARRRRGAAKADKLGIRVGKSDDWEGFWPLLEQNLESRFATAPVHSLAEIELLRERFPDNIGLYLARLGDEILAGVVVYQSAAVAHSQYVATTPHGRETGALDKLFSSLLEGPFAQTPVFDFGISNEQQGRVLNRGLIEQKEGFGARAVVHDFYLLEL